MGGISAEAVILDRAATSDIDLLTPLVEAYHAFEGIALTRDRRRAALTRLLGEPALGAVWFVKAGPAETAPLGYVALCLGYSIEFAGIDAFVDELYLIEAARGRGVGGRVLDLVTDEAAALGVCALHLEVDRENHRARRLYGAKGFAARDRFTLMSRAL